MFLRRTAIAAALRSGWSMLAAACLLAFLSTFSLVIITTSVGYHRALCHGAVRLHPLVQKLLLTWAVWITAIDPKAWVVMHRLHHEHSDTPLDPHSPRNVGFGGMLLAQIRGYNGTVDRLRAREPIADALGSDLPMSLPTRLGMWWAPYVVHALLGAALCFVVPWPIVLSGWLGLVSHAAQGAVINTFGHAIGTRNFDLDDASVNNHPAAWALLGEGFQNNHHRYPASARFSYLPNEHDFGYVLCLAFQRMGLLTISEATLMPRVALAQGEHHGA